MGGTTPEAGDASRPVTVDAPRPRSDPGSKRDGNIESLPVRRGAHRWNWSAWGRRAT